MSNNAAVTQDGGEIGRAQALQALACGLAPSVHMNPVLIKPESEIGAQVVVQGKRLTSTHAADFAELKPRLLDKVLESFHHLKHTHDLVLVEGAGSPAEINLRQGDIANMGFACAADVPVVLAGDIDRGGVIAQIVGTQAVLSDQDNARISGFLINKFRGDVSLFDQGYRDISNRTGWPGFGVLPYFHDARLLPAEDALDLPETTQGTDIHIACLALSRIANFDDLDPIVQEPGVSFTMVLPGQAIPGDASLVIIPGTKSTRGDLGFLKDQGWDIDIRAHMRRGGRVLGICGGYQMLGRVIQDPDGIEGPAGETAGLGLLDVTTTMQPEKTLTQVSAHHVGTGKPISGYEIHIGQTSGPDRDHPFAMVDGTPEGATSGDGRIMGSYLHGMFTDDAFRHAFLESLGALGSTHAYSDTVTDTLDALADHMETHLDVTGLLELAR